MTRIEFNKKDVELLIAYEQLMIIDEIPSNEKSSAINLSVKRIIECMGLRQLEAILELSRDKIPTYLYDKIASRWDY